MADTNLQDPTPASGRAESGKPDPAPVPASVPRERPTPEGDGLDPTRYGDWEKNGRCIDF